MRTRRLLLILLFSCVLLLSCASEALPSDVRVRVRFVDVGQGDCILIRTHEGDILIDSGPESSQRTLCTHLSALGIKELRLAIFTHLDEDHIGGADGVLRRFPAKEIWTSRDDAEGNESARQLWDAAKACDAEIVTVSEGKTWKLGDVVLYVLAPFTDVTDSNESSIVVKLTCGEAAAIFTGDISTKTERELIGKYGEHLSCRLYKAGHHGSSTSNCAEWIAAMSPTYAVICCGVANEYGHPHGEVLSRFASAGVTVYRTDRSGDVVFDCDGKNFIPIKK